MACIKETLRFDPPANDVFPRTSPPTGYTLTDGTFIPPGVAVGTNPWSNNRDPAVFGPDADEFRPGRWLDQDKEKVRDMERFNNTFGFGPRICLGKELAEQELNIFLKRFWEEFEVKYGKSKLFFKIRL